MLHPLKVDELVKIAEKAYEHMVEIDIPDCDLAAIIWDDEEYAWCVKFYSEYGTFPFTNVYVCYGDDGSYSGEYTVESANHDTD